MGRKISVELEADVAGFIRNVLEADESVDNLGDKVDKLDRDLNKIPGDAAKAAAALKLLGGNVNDVGTKIGSLGEKNASLAVLDAKIRETTSEVKKLAEEFVKTGDVDVFKKLSDSRGRLQGLQAVRKKVADAVLPDEERIDSFFKQVATKLNGLGDSIAKMLPDAVSGALSTPVLGPAVAGAVVLMVLSAVTTVLATAGGLVSAAGVGGALGLGIMGAIMGNPEVISARWKTAVEGIKHEFVDAAHPFQQPLIDAATQVRAAFGGLGLDQTLAKAATYLQPLLTGALGFARAIGQAINSLTMSGAPVVKVLADELPKIGAAIASAADSIAGGSEGGAQALKDLLGIIEGVIAGLGELIGNAEKVYGALAKFRDAVIPRDWLFPPDAPAKLDNGARALHAVGDSAKSTVVDLDAMNAKLSQTETTMDSLEGTIVNKVLQATLGLDDAVLSVARANLALTETFKENGLQIDKHTGQISLNTAKGLENRDAVMSLVRANIQTYQANLAVGMSAEDAARAYDDGTASIEAQLKALHLNQGQIDGLIGKYKNIPHKVDTDIAINGLTHAIEGLTDLIKQINGIHDKTVTIYYRTQGQSLNAPLAHGGIRRAAVGMVIPPSDPGTTLVGEPQTGGEALIPLRGISQGRAMGLAQTVGDAYGFSVSSSRSSALSLTLVFSGGNDDFLNRAVQRGFDDGRIQVYAGGQRVQTRP